MKVFSCLILTLALLVSSGFAQTVQVPKFKKGESYTSIRKKLIKANWKPFTATDADTCTDGDERCQGRPEMQSCAGTGMANCRFLWKKSGKTLVVFTVGETAVYDGRAFEEIPEN